MQIITHNSAASRFETSIDGHLCICQYRVFGKTMMLTHTGVPQALRGRGIAAALVQAAVFDAVNGINPRYTPIRVTPAAAPGASRRAAAVQAEGSMACR